MRRFEFELAQRTARDCGEALNDVLAAVQDAAGELPHEHVLRLQRALGIALASIARTREHLLEGLNDK